MYFNQELINSYGLNMQNPTAQAMMGAGNTAPMFNSLNGNMYQQNPSMYQNQQYMYNNPQMNGYYTQPQQQQMYNGGYMGLPNMQMQQNNYYQQPNNQAMYNYQNQQYMYNNPQMNGYYTQQQSNEFIPQPPKKLDWGGVLRGDYLNKPEQSPYAIDAGITVPPTPTEYYNEANPYQSYNPYDPESEAGQEYHQYDTAREMYNKGLLNLAEYTSMANGGIEHVTENGTHVYDQPYYSQQQSVFDPFYIPGHNSQAQNEYREKLNQNAEAWSIASNAVNRYFGIDPVEAAQQTELQRKSDASLDFRLYQEAAVEKYWDYFFEDIKLNYDRSDEKGYISPVKRRILAHQEKVYNRRHKNIPENYTLEEFTNGGIYTQMMFNDMKYEEKERMKNLVMLYDDPSTRQMINMASPLYDPFKGYCPRGFMLNKNELTITVPPEIMAERYGERRKIFLDSTRKNYDQNIVDDMSYFRSYKTYDDEKLPFS